MSKENIIRAWKNPEYRNSLTNSERAALPENPAGAVALSPEDLEQVSGGFLSLFWCDPPPDPYPSLFCTFSLSCPDHCGAPEPKKI
jgi:mersacidin/lichenicidin family type 2 lantibiotic